MVLVGEVNRDLVATINREALDDPVAVGGRRRGWRPADHHARAIRRSASSATSPMSAPSGCTACSTRAWRRSSRRSAPIASGQPYNINADEAAMAIAVAMEAEKIVYLTAAPGLLEDAEGREQPDPAPDLRRAARADRA